LKKIGLNAHTNVPYYGYLSLASKLDVKT